MLRELKIENLAIIKKLDLSLDRGMVVLTGETGAGKSIILDGVNLLIGEKVSQDMIRSDCDFLKAEGVFEVSGDTLGVIREHGIECEDSEIIVRREYDRAGKGKIVINGARVTVSNLKEIMDTVVDLVGQYSHQMLLQKKYHIRLIDKFLDENDMKLKENVAAAYQNYKKTSAEIENIESRKKEAEEKKDLYEFHLQEINQVNPKYNEDDELEAEYKKLFNAGKIIENLGKTIVNLKDGETNALKYISQSRAALEYLTRYSEEYNPILQKVENAFYELEDAAYAIDAILSDTDNDEKRLTLTATRLEKLNKLKKKYQKTINEIIEYKNFIEKSIDLIDVDSLEEKRLHKELEICKENYKQLAGELTGKRRKIAAGIEYRLVNELKDLNMKNIVFKAVFSGREEMTENGSDNIEFMISTNIGEELKPLAKIASGGEVSRIMLALKAIFSNVDSIPILIFDEIDTGIGGETVRKVANKLRQIAENVQVVCITHSPQIAAMAGEHFFIEKIALNGTTETIVKKLNAAERELEISRMIAGDSITSVVRQHAAELLKEGREWTIGK